MSNRDLKGYGANPPNANWPKKARIAVSFVLNYEEGGENVPLANGVSPGDTHSEVFLSETPGGTARKTRDLNMESIYEYGSVFIYLYLNQSTTHAVLNYTRYFALSNKEMWFLAHSQAIRSTPPSQTYLLCSWSGSRA